MPVSKIDIPAGVDSLEKATALLFQTIQSYNELVDNIHATDASVPIFGSINAAGLLSPNQKGGLTGGSVTSLHKHDASDIENLPAGGGSLASITVDPPLVLGGTPTDPNIALSEDDLAVVRSLIAQAPLFNDGDANDVILRLDTTGLGGGASDYVYAKSTVDSTGATSVVAGIQTLVAAMGTTPTTLVFERGTYLVNSDLDLSAKDNLLLLFQTGAKLRVDGAVLRHVGMLEAPLMQIFECVNGGRVEFFSGTNWITKGALIPETFTEWFGAKGNNSAIDTEPFRRAADAIRGFPHDPTVLNSWIRSAIKLRAGGRYVLDGMWTPCEGSVALALEGAGQKNTIVTYKNAQSMVTREAASYPTTSQVEFVSLPAGDHVGKWLVPAGPTYLGGPPYYTDGSEGFTVGNSSAREITAQAGNVLTTNGTHGWTVTGNMFYILDMALVNLSGVHNVTMKDMSLGVDSTSALLHVLKYHRDARKTASGTSKGNFFNVDVTGRVHISQWEIGSWTPGQTTWQADLTSFWGCTSVGDWKNQAGDGRALWYGSGFRFGGPLFSNPLNYTCNGCVSTGHRKGVIVASTNVKWQGGTIQSNEHDIYCYNGGQSFASFGGFRSEGSNMLLGGMTTQSTAFHIRVYDVEFRSEDNVSKKPDTGTYDVVRLPWPGTVELEGLRFTGYVQSYPNKAQNPAPYTGIGTDGSGNGYLDDSTAAWTVNEWAGECIIVQDTAVSSNGRVYEVLSNTATRVIIKGTWETGSHGGTGETFGAPNGTTRTFRLTHVPRIRYTGVSSVNVKAHGLLVAPNMGHHQIFPARGVAQEWDIDMCPPCGPGTVIVNLAHFGREGHIRYGRETNAVTDYGNLSAVFVPGFASFNLYTHSRVTLNTSGTIYLGGGTVTGNPIPLPSDGQRFELETVMDATGGRVVTWNTTLNLIWSGGSAPAPQPANKFRIYEFRRRGNNLYARVLFDE